MIGVNIYLTVVASHTALTCHIEGIATFHRYIAGRFTSANPLSFLVSSQNHLYKNVSWAGQPLA